MKLLFQFYIYVHVMTEMYLQMWINAKNIRGTLLSSM